MIDVTIKEKAFHFIGMRPTTVRNCHTFSSNRPFRDAADDWNAILEPDRGRRSDRKSNNIVFDVNVFREF